MKLLIAAIWMLIVAVIWSTRPVRLRLSQRPTMPFATTAKDNEEFDQPGLITTALAVVFGVGLAILLFWALYALVLYLTQ